MSSEKPNKCCLVLWCIFEAWVDFVSKVNINAHTYKLLHFTSKHNAEKGHGGVLV